MKRSDYLEMRKKLEEEYQDKISSLDKVFAMFGGRPVSEGSDSTAAAKANGWNHDITKRDAIREAIQELTVASFSLKDVRSVLDGKFPDRSNGISDNQLSANLSKLAELHEITVEKAKVGKSPAVYARKKGAS